MFVVYCFSVLPIKFYSINMVKPMIQDFNALELYHISTTAVLGMLSL